MTRAPAAHQTRLLEVQALDTRAAQLAHRRRTLPVLADLAGVRAEKVDLDRDLVLAQTAVKDLRRELAKAELDVEQVRTRAARDRQRLDSGAGSAKDLQAISHELESLARRQGVLEEVELEVMERLETAEASLQEASGRLGAVVEREGTLASQAEAELAEVDAQAEAVARDREGAVVGLDPGLVALYERIRAHSGGMGAAALRGKRCEGCRLELNPTELERIKGSAADDVVRCEECGRILVRPEGAE